MGDGGFCGLKGCWQAFFLSDPYLVIKARFICGMVKLI